MTRSTNDGDETQHGTTREGQLADPPWSGVTLRYAFNPDFESLASSDPDELVVFEPGRDAPGDRWMTAERGSFVGLDDAR